jgi:FkbM family methyltransferase
MKYILKQIIKIPLNVLFFYVNIFFIFKKRIHYYLIDQINNKFSKKKSVVRFDEKKIYIFTPNQLCQFRADTFFTKEPETINWINTFQKESIFYDIGANIGIYSIYHAIKNNSKCYAFEPSFYNLVQLSKNINENECNDKISVITNPLSNRNTVEAFNYSSTIEGGALSSFGVNFSYDGKPIDKFSSVNKLGMCLDELIFNNYLIDKPNYIKIDVDGIEHLILEGAKKTLQLECCKSILVEINEELKDQSELSNKILTDSGYKIQNKLQSTFTNKNYGFEKIYNQIWEK